MAYSFSDSAKRHRADAKHLASDQRLQNAGHLIGFAAECLTKAVLEDARIQIDKPSGLRVHFPQLATAIRIRGYGRLMGALLPILSRSDFLNGWKAELRYEKDQIISQANADWQKWVGDVDDLFVAAGRP